MGAFLGSHRCLDRLHAVLSHVARDGQSARMVRSTLHHLQRIEELLENIVRKLDHNDRK